MSEGFLTRGNTSSLPLFLVLLQPDARVHPGREAFLEIYLKTPPEVFASHQESPKASIASCSTSSSTNLSSAEACPERQSAPRDPGRMRKAASLPHHHDLGRAWRPIDSSSRCDRSKSSSLAPDHLSARRPLDHLTNLRPCKRGPPPYSLNLGRAVRVNLRSSPEYASLHPTSLLGRARSEPSEAARDT